MLWLVLISLNQSQSSWAALRPGCCDGSLVKQCGGGTCFGGTFALREASPAIKVADSLEKADSGRGGECQ